MAQPLAAISFLPLPLEASPRFLPAGARKDDLEKVVRPSSNLGFGSAVHPTNDVHELFDLFPLLGLVARSDGVLHTMGDVISQDLLFEPPEGGADGGDLKSRYRCSIDPPRPCARCRAPGLRSDSAVSRTMP